VEGLARVLAATLHEGPLEEDELPWSWEKMGPEPTARWLNVAQAAYNYTRPVLTEAEWGVVVESLEERAASLEYLREGEPDSEIDKIRAVSAKIKARGK